MCILIVPVYLLIIPYSDNVRTMRFRQPDFETDLILTYIWLRRSIYRPSIVLKRDWMTSDLYPDFRSQCCICHNNNTLFYLCLILFQLLTEYRHKFSTDYKSIAVIEQGTFHKFDVCFPDISLTTYCQTLPTCIAYSNNELLV